MASARSKLEIARYQTKTDWVAGQLRLAISDGRILPEERIRLQEWAERLGVSSTPVREAVKILEAAGYLKVLPHRGARVSSFSSKEFLEYYRMRAALDPLAAEFVADRLSKVERRKVSKQLRRLNNDFREALERRDFPGALRINRDFHMTIYRAADSSVLLDAVAPLSDIFPKDDQLSLETATSTAAARKALIDEHEAIIEALEHGDPIAASVATREHFQIRVQLLMEAAMSRLRETAIQPDAASKPATWPRPKRMGDQRDAKAATSSVSVAPEL